MPDLAKLVDDLSALTVIEAAQLSKMLEEKWGVSAAAPVAVAAFGVSAYELAAYGVPALYLSLTKDHALSASAFEQAGMGLSLGTIDDVTDEAIEGATRQLMSDAQRRRVA